MDALELLPIIPFLLKNGYDVAGDALDLRIIAKLFTRKTRDAIRTALKDQPIRARYTEGTQLVILELISQRKPLTTRGITNARIEYPGAPCPRLTRIILSCVSNFPDFFVKKAVSAILAPSVKSRNIYEKAYVKDAFKHAYLLSSSVLNQAFDALPGDCIPVPLFEALVGKRQNTNLLERWIAWAENEGEGELVTFLAGADEKTYVPVFVWLLRSFGGTSHLPSLSDMAWYYGDIFKSWEKRSALLDCIQANPHLVINRKNDVLELVKSVVFNAGSHVVATLDAIQRAGFSFEDDVAFWNVGVLNTHNLEIVKYFWNKGILSFDDEGSTQWLQTSSQTGGVGRDVEIVTYLRSTVSCKPAVRKMEIVAIN